MKNLIAISAGVLIASTAAFAQPMSSGRAEIMSSLPNNSATVTDWYKQTVYDPSDNKIGEIMDVLVSPDGRATALIVGVGGFLGAGEKDVAVAVLRRQAHHEEPEDLSHHGHHQGRA